MYNRYVPQGDGSFQRSAVPDPPRRDLPKEPPRPAPPPDPLPLPVKDPPQASPPPAAMPPVAACLPNTPVATFVDL